MKTSLTLARLDIFEKTVSMLSQYLDIIANILLYIHECKVVSREELRYLLGSDLEDILTLMYMLGLIKSHDRKIMLNDVGELLLEALLRASRRLEMYMRQEG